MPALASEVWPGAIDYVGAPPTTTRATTSRLGERSARRSGRAGASRAGLRGQRLRNLRVLQRDASGRVARLRRRRLHAGRDHRPRLPDGGRPRRRLAADQEHGVRGRRTGIGLSLPRPRVRPWRRLVRDWRRQSRGVRRDGRRDPAVLLSDAAGRARRATRSRRAASRATNTGPAAPARTGTGTMRTDVRVALPASEETERPRSSSSCARAGSNRVGDRR